MATEEKENPYERAGFGTGGKFRRRPFRRTQTTPYDRPPTALRNPNRNNGWLSKLVDPAQRLIVHGAHSLFSSLFRKRLPPPPPHSSEMEQEVRDNHQEEAAIVANNSSGEQQGAVGESNVQINFSDGGGLTELEKLLKQKTFTRSEIDHLTALLHSRTVDTPVREEEKRTEMVPSEPMLPRQKEEYPKTPALENGIENHLVLTPHVTSSVREPALVPIEDVASPAELAKIYMGSRNSKVSSMFGMQNPALGEDPTLLKKENFPHKSPIMSIVPRASRHAAVHENGFVTPRSRGRSAIYSMARTPYTRIYQTSPLKGGGLAVQGEPSSSTQSALDHDMLSGSKQGAKRSNLALDNDIGSVGPIRRVRHKSNLLYSDGSSLPPGSSFSVSRSRLGIDAALQPSSSMQKPILPDEVKHSHMKLSEENADGTKPSMSFPPLPSKSSEMGSKILQQLDKLVSPNEKPSESRLPIVNDNSSMKLSPSMLRGQALRSMERADSSKLLDNIQGKKLDGTFGNFSANAQNQKIISQRDKVQNGPLKFVAHSPSDELVPVLTTTDATKPRNQVLSSEKSVDSFMIKSVSYPSQKRRAFHMSAHEDSLDLDDDAYTNGAVSSFSPVEKETSSTAMAEKISSGSEVIARENPSTLSVVMPSKSFTTDGEAHVKTPDVPRVAEKVDVSTSMTSSISYPTYKPATVAAATVTSFGSDKPASPNGSIANPSLFDFGNKMVSSTELTATAAPSKEITKSGPIFGLEKVVSSKEPGAGAGAGAGAPLVNFGTNKSLDKVPPMPFTASTSVGGESSLKFVASSDSQLGNSISSTTVAGATDSMQKVLESDNGDAKNNTDTGFSVRAPEIAVSSAASTSLLTSPTGIFSFSHSMNQNNGSLASSSSFSSSFSSFVSNNNFTSQNMFSSSSLSSSSGIGATAASTGISTATPAIIASSNNSSSTPVVATSPSTTSFFKFGPSSVPSTGLPVSSSGSAPLETKSGQDAGIGNVTGTAFGSSSAAVGSTGSAIFGFSTSAMTTVTSQSQCSVIGASSSSVLGAQASPSTGGFATSTQTLSGPFGSSASSPLFGLTGNTAFSSGSSLFPSSSSAANTAFSSGNSVFPSSSATNIFNSGTTFGHSTSASSSEVNSISSNSGTSSTLFGTSSWQPSKSPFGSTFSSSSSSGFSFGTSAASTSSPMMFSSMASASAPKFSFTSAAAATTSTQPVFGSPNPVFTFGSAPVNNDQTSMEDSMAEDIVQASPPATPIFGQQHASVQSNFAFGASTPSGTSPFQFGSQQNIAQQNHSFQASGSLEFNAGGGSFSLGSGGGDKSGRKFLKVKHRQRKK